MKISLDRHPIAPEDDRARILLVADWSVDPRAVIAACLRHHTARPASYPLLVPARLRGLDWIGDPAASCPCAQRQLEQLIEQAAAAGLSYSVAGVGDPSAVAAIEDALAESSADEVLLCSPTRRIAPSHALGLRRRVRRLTGLEVAQVRLPASAELHTRMWSRFGRGHCGLEQPQVA